MHTDTMDTKVSNGITNSAIPKDKLMEDLRLAASDAQDLLRATTNQAGVGMAAAGVKVQESLKVVKEKLMAAEAAFMEQTRQAAKITDQYVHESPWKAVGISAVAGLLVGILIARR